MRVLSLLWWFLVLAAAVQAGRAWRAPMGVLTLLGLWILAAAIPWVGGLLTVALAVVIGYRAENDMQHKQLTGDARS